MFFSKIPKSKYITVAPVEQTSAILNASIFQQNVGTIPQLKFLLAKNDVHVNSSVDTSYNAETGKGSIYVTNSKDNYTGEGVVE